MSAWTIEGRFRGQRVALVWGGLSNEREVSGWTAKAVQEALEGRGYEVASVDAGRDLPQALAAADPAVVFIALHGTYGEDGRLQGMLDWMGLPYTGEGIQASILAMDKGLTKQILRGRGAPVLDDVAWRRGQGARPTVADLPFPLPVVIKPIAEGSSVGVYFAATEAAFEAALDEAAEHPALIIEPQVEGVEISVACLGDEILGSVEIEPLRDFYDYTAKYLGGGTRYHLPPRLDPEILAAAERVGLQAHMGLGCQGLTRTDVIVRPEGPVILEVNTLPGMTPTSLVPKIAATRGLSFPDLIELLLDRAACARELSS